MKLRILLAQPNHVYGASAFLPYSVGLLQAYAMKDELIKSEYEFLTPIFRREKISDVVQRVGRVNVFGASVYIWNSSYCLALAKAVKEANPNCLVVLGGPHVPVESKDYFHLHPYADLLVHYEGEQTFRDILNNLAFSGRKYQTIAGLTLNDGGRPIKAPARERIHELDEIPSPYLTGVFDELVKLPYQWLPTWEGTRGCPYACTFCDWGSATFSKIKKHSDPYLEEEIEWAARHQAPMLYSADANFGILERDVRLVEVMVKAKEKYGSPGKFRAAYAKNNVDRVFTINKMLAAAGMSKGATLSFQSMDENTLDIIKRRNIGTEKYAQLMRKYNEEDIPTYSEIIIGLPGETYDTFADGLNALLKAGAHASISVYTCECLPNSEMSQPAYRAEHGIEGVMSPIPFYHACPDNEDSETEHYELVVRTNTLPRADWLNCQLFSWAVQAFHCLGATQACAVHLHHRDGISYRQYYEHLLRFARTHPGTLIGTLYTEALTYFIAMREGHSLPILRSYQFGNVSWPPEEWAYLLMVKGRWQFYGELPHHLTTPESLTYQMAVTSAPLEGTLTKKLPIGFPHALHQMKLGDPLPDTSEDWVEHEFVPITHYSSLEMFAREAVWFARKSTTKRVEVQQK